MLVQSFSKRKSALSLFLLGMIFLLIGCEHNQGVTQPPVAVMPTLTDIQAKILTPKCALPACHVPGGNAPMSLQSGVSYTTLVGPAGTGVPSTGYQPLLRVSPGDSSISVLYLKVTGNARTAGRMPLGSASLDAALEIPAIARWINTGAQNN